MKKRNGSKLKSPVTVNWNVVYYFLITLGIFMTTAFYWFTKAFE
ncbi:MAG: hypothetical protein PVH88_11935 [Ignavibacteria bacterium]